MPDMAKTSNKCSLEQLPRFNKKGNATMVSLFEKKRLNGYWPCFTDDPELLGEGEEVKLAVSGDSSLF